MKFIHASLIALAAMAGACEKGDPGKAVRGLPKTSPLIPQDMKPATPTAPLPEIHSPDLKPGPMPGQANDHSSPDFKRGDEVAKK